MSTAPSIEFRRCGDQESRSDEGLILYRFCAQVTLTEEGDSEHLVQIGALSERPEDPLLAKEILVYHPGGPGVSAVEGLFADPPAVSYERFAVLTWDGRTASVEANSCGPESTDFGTDRDVRFLADASAAVAAECIEGLGWRLGTGEGAVEAAEELEAVREALAIERFDILTQSYGTAIAEAYLDAQPQHVRRAVLDGPVALEVLWPERLRAVEGAVRFTVDRMLRSCAQATCGAEVSEILRRGSGYEAVRALVLSRSPTVGVSTLRLTPTVMDQAALIAARDPRYWQTFRTGVKDALGGDASTLWELGERYYFGLDRSVFYASLCADLELPRTVSGFLAGPSLINTYGSEYAPCLGYPSSSAGTTSPDSAGRPPDVLIVASRHDVLTPAALLESARNLRRLGTVCTTDVLAHTSSVDPDVRRLIARFLARGELAGAGRICG